MLAKSYECTQMCLYVSFHQISYDFATRNSYDSWLYMSYDGTHEWSCDYTLVQSYDSISDISNLKSYDS